jgi:hypothetical protein
MILSKPAAPVVTGTAPANQTVPSISGVTASGQTLNASSGTWSGSPTGYAYQWKRCSSAGSGCAAIAGATAATYLLQSSDVGSTLRVSVTATNAWGSGSADSAATSAVTGETSYNDNVIGTNLNQFTYVGTWNYQTTSTWAYQGDNHNSWIRDSYYLFRFSGTQLKLYATKGPSFGIGAYSIDGGPETLVDQFAPGRHDQQLVFTSSVLASGPHTLKVRVTRTKNVSATSFYINVDRAVVTS